MVLACCCHDALLTVPEPEFIPALLAAQAADLQFRQAPTMADCFPASQKAVKEVIHEPTGTVLQVRISADCPARHQSDLPQGLFKGQLQNTSMPATHAISIVRRGAAVYQLACDTCGPRIVAHRRGSIRARSSFRQPPFHAALLRPPCCALP